MEINKNKKGEGTASTFLISSVVAFSLLLIIGININLLADSYSKDNVGYFSNYTTTRDNINNVSDVYVKDYDFNTTDSNNLIERMEDNLFFKAFKIIGKLPSLIGGLTNGLATLGEDIGIPSEFIYLLLTILGITLITLIIKIIRGFNNV